MTGLINWAFFGYSCLAEATLCFLCNTCVVSTQIKIPDFFPAFQNCSCILCYLFFIFSLLQHVTRALFCCQTRINAWDFYIVSQAWSSTLFQCPEAEDIASASMGDDDLTEHMHTQGLLYCLLFVVLLKMDCIYHK